MFFLLSEIFIPFQVLAHVGRALSYVLSRFEASADFEPETFGPAAASSRATADSIHFAFSDTCSSLPTGVYTFEGTLVTFGQSISSSIYFIWPFSQHFHFIPHKRLALTLIKLISFSFQFVTLLGFERVWFLCKFNEWASKLASKDFAPGTFERQSVSKNRLDPMQKCHQWWI